MGLAVYGSDGRLCGLAGWRIFPYTPLAAVQVQPSRAPTPDAVFRLLIANILMQNQHYERFIGLVCQIEPDVVLALEIRLTRFVQDAGMSVIAVVWVIIATAMPAMELVPLSANGAGAALTAFGLALIAHDGLLALLAFLFTALTFGLVVYNLL